LGLPRQRHIEPRGRVGRSGDRHPDEGHSRPLPHSERRRRPAGVSPCRRARPGCGRSGRRRTPSTWPDSYRSAAAVNRRRTRRRGEGTSGPVRARWSDR
jgi:hypothetical protein